MNNRNIVALLQVISDEHVDKLYKENNLHAQDIKSYTAHDKELNNAQQDDFEGVIYYDYLGDFGVKVSINGTPLVSNYKAFSVSQGQYYISCFYIIYEDECEVKELKPGIFQYVHHIDKTYASAYLDKKHKSLVISPDVELFIDSIKIACAEKGYMLRCSPVTYDFENFATDYKNLYAIFNNQPNQTMQQLFHKSKSHENEREYRIVIRPSILQREDGISINLGNIRGLRSKCSFGRIINKNDDIVVTITKKCILKK